MCMCLALASDAARPRSSPNELTPGRAATRTMFVACSYELQNELSNEKRFKKAVVAGVNEVRNGLGDGLFTVRPPTPTPSRVPPRAIDGDERAR